MKLSLRKGDLEILIWGYVYIIVFYLFAGIGFDMFLFSFIHVSLSSVLLIYIFHKTETSVKNGSYSMVSLTLLTIGIYAQLCSLKYLIPYLYPGFISNNVYRLLGSIYTFIIILLCTKFWSLFNRHHYIQCSFALPQSKMVIGIFTVLLIVLYSIKVLNTYLFNISILTFSNGTMDEFVNLLLLSLATFFCSVYVKKRNNAKNILHWCLSYIPAVILIFVGFLASMLTGKRYQFIIPIMYFIGSLMVQRKIKLLTLKRIFAFVPCLLVIMTMITNATSNRLESNSYWYLRNFVYRFDISDFAITLSANTEISDYSVSTVFEAIQQAVPSIISKNKDLTSLSQYQTLMNDANLSITEDYDDTVFSMGSEVGGFVGMFFIPLLFILFLEIVDFQLKRHGPIFNSFRILLSFYFVIVESTWDMFMLNTRNVVLMFLVTIFILKIVSIRKKLR